MLLVVDVGNTQTHFGTYRGTALVEHWRFATVRDETADELAGKLANLLALRALTFGDLDGAIVSSTVPALGIEWGEVGRRYLDGELLLVGERIGLDGDALGQTSRLVAKVDSAAVQDGFELYLHGFIVADDGRWVVVQQGMSDARRQARRSRDRHA